MWRSQLIRDATSPAWDTFCVLDVETLPQPHCWERSGSVVRGFLDGASAELGQGPFHDLLVIPENKDKFDPSNALVLYRTSWCRCDFSMQGWFIPFPCVPITFPSKSLWLPESFKPARNQNGLYLKGFSPEAGIRIHTCIHIIQGAQLVWWKNGDDFQILNVCFGISLFLLCCLPSFQIGNLEWTEMHILIPGWFPWTSHVFTFHEQEVIGHRANPLLYRSFEKQKEIFIACTSIRRDLEMILWNEEVPMAPTFSGEWP